MLKIVCCPDFKGQSSLLKNVTTHKHSINTFPSLPAILGVKLSYLPVILSVPLLLAEPEIGLFNCHV